MTKTSTDHHTSKHKLLDAAVKLIRTKGFAATSIDNLCAETGLTKGGFFHHFKNKEELGLAVAQHWTDTTAPFFDAAPYQQLPTPLERILGYIDFRKSILQGTLAEFTCLAGTLAQEVHTSYPVIAHAAGDAISSHALTLVKDIQSAMDGHGGAFPCTAQSLALHTQVVLQGGFIIAKSTGDVRHAEEAIDHLKSYVKLLFGRNVHGNAEI